MTSPQPKSSFDEPDSADNFMMSTEDLPMIKAATPRKLVEKVTLWRCPFPKYAKTTARAR
jgi:hypothetical protein